MALEENTSSSNKSSQEKNMQEKPTDFLSFLSYIEDPIERARRQDPEDLRQYAEQKERAKIQNEIRTLEDWGIYPRSRELPRSEYLKRLTSNELENLCSLLQYTWVHSSRDSSFGVIAIGTLTYDKKHWQSLKELTKLKNATYFEYETNFSWQTEPKNKRPFNMEDIIQNKGEDIDLMICPIDQYDLEKQFLIIDTVKQYASSHQIPFIETDDISIIGTQYATEPPIAMLKKGEQVEVQRIKLLGEKIHTIKLTPPNCRPLHIYFDRQNMHEKLYEERSAGYNFSTLMPNCWMPDFIDAVENGKKTGIYENPVLLEYKKK